MRKRFLITVVLGGCLAGYGAAAGARRAVADLKTPSGESIGKVTFTGGAKGVVADISLTKAPAGQHGIHIHQTGSCTAPDFTSAGGHFNPESHHHGGPGVAESHAGDLGNVTAGANGKGHARVTRTDLSLTGGSNALLKEGGTSVVLHATADDLKTDPSGNSGARIACGEVKAQ